MDNFFLRFFTLLFAAMLCSANVTTIIEGSEALFTPSTPLALQPTPQDLQEHSFFSLTALLPLILFHLGFHELATIAPSLSDATSTASWIDPSNIFPASDTSIRTCYSCSIPNLLRGHIVPGFFAINYLWRHAFGAKIKTLSSGRCITVTVTFDYVHLNTSSDATAKIFIRGVEITQSDLFNNGMVVVHSIHSFISPLSSFSCDVERMTSLSFPFHPDHRSSQHLHHTPSDGATTQPTIMRLMLPNAMLMRLSNNSFSIFELAMKVKAELVTLNNRTVFAVNDLSIFSDSPSYISSVKFHIMLNRYLSIADLEELLMGTTLPTLERRQMLLITTSDGRVSLALMRINQCKEAELAVGGFDYFTLVETWPWGFCKNSLKPCLVTPIPSKVYYT